MVRKLIFRALVCPFVGHARTRNKVREVDGIYTSVCARCGTPVRRLLNRQWVGDRQARNLRARS
jgi:hypothetical protein